MKIDSNALKKKAYSLGCNLCGIASIGRFSEMPPESNPLNILPEGKSVIIIALRFLDSTLASTSTIPYTIIRNYLSRKIDEITIELSYFLENSGFLALPTGAIEPCNYNREISKLTGLISLKYAAYQVGLGVIGKNTLLITPEFGNMVWLGGVITSADLEADPLLKTNPCREACRICIDRCPVKAIDGSHFMDQSKCWNFAFGPEGSGEWRIKCHRCRTGCPYNKGFKI